MVMPSFASLRARSVAGSAARDGSDLVLEVRRQVLAVLEETAEHLSHGTKRLRG